MTFIQTNEFIRVHSCVSIFVNMMRPQYPHIGGEIVRHLAFNHGQLLPNGSPNVTADVPYKDTIHQKEITEF